MMSNIRWTDNDVAGTKAVSGSAILLTLFVLYIPVCLLGWIVSFITLVIGLAGQGAFIFVFELIGFVFELIGLPSAFPLVALVFVPTGRWLVRHGRFGLLNSIVLGMFAVLVSTGLLGYLTLSEELGLWTVLAVVNCSVTYGFPLGVLVWQRLAVEQPNIFVLPTSSPPRFGGALLVCAVAIVGWQLLVLLLSVLASAGGADLLVRRAGVGDAQ